MSDHFYPTIVLAADHGGFHIKEYLKGQLSELGYEWVDCGAWTLDPDDDYPFFAFNACQKLLELAKDGVDARVILSCRSASGMVIAANKINGIRAVAVTNQWEAEHSAEHNHANCIALGGSELTAETALSLSLQYLQTPWDLHPRHLRRIAQIEQIEKGEVL